MATIETVNIADVYPLVDEYGNDMARRDYSKKVNQDYVHQLARSMAKKGIPDEMVTLVRDGGIYRIKAGNSRVMAMRELGTKTFPAIVEEENTVQEVLSTVIRTNTKKKYEPEEESCFVRQLALFADNEYVSEVTGLETKDVARIRKAAIVVDDGADDMSLLRLIAIGEFADDAKAVEELTNCTEREFHTIASRIRDRKAKEQNAAMMARAFKERGIPIVKEAPGMRLVSTIGKVEDIPEDIPEGAVAMAHNMPGFFMLLVPTDKEYQAQEAEKDAKRAKAEAIGALYKEGTHRRREWLAEQINAQSLLPNLSRLVEEDPNRFSYRVKEFLSEVSVAHIRVGYCEIIAHFEQLDGSNFSNGIYDYFGNATPFRCREYITLIDALKSDGYEPNEDEQAIYQQAIDHLEDAQ